MVFDQIICPSLQWLPQTVVNVITCNLSRCIQVRFEEREPKLGGISTVHDVRGVGDDADGHGQGVDGHGNAALNNIVVPEAG